MILAAAVAAAAIVFAVTFRIIDSDFWQHLLVGRVMWEGRSIPREHLWSWVSYGRPEVLPSWLFRALIWPFYEWGGVPGLFVWRWLTTLLVFGFLWAAARRMGARGLTPLVVLVWCALLYRLRSQVRPETLAAVLMAIQIWILESRRHEDPVRGGPAGADARGAGSGASRGRLAFLRDPIVWLVPIASAWVNAHVSFFIAFVLLGIHALDGVAARLGPSPGPGERSRSGSPASPGERARRASLRPMWLAGLAMLVASFLNPFGWQALWQPFDYALHLSKEPLFRGIGELQPMSWNANTRNGAWLMIAGWPILALWRARRHGLDRVEALTCLLATAYAIPSQRFLGVYAVAAAPYLARDLDEWVRSRPWPRWTAGPAARSALAAGACLAIGIPEARRPILTPGLDVDLERFPVAACDFMERHGVGGRGFSHFRFVGYQLWRFWPERARLPFMDIHQSGAPEDRAYFAAAFTDPAGTWPRLAERYRLDYLVLDRRQRSGAELLDVADADTAWGLAFVDDTAALYVRRAGPLGAVADSFAYRHLRAGEAHLADLAARAAADSSLREALRPELKRAISESRWSATLLGQLANLDLADGRLAEARAHLEGALAADRRLIGAHQRLGVIALWEERWMDAVREFERERRLHGPQPGLELGIGVAFEQAGDLTRAREHYTRELAMDPGSAGARERLAELGRKGR